MIKFENVSKIYKNGAYPALDNVSLEIEKGEFVFLIGSSGSGKSTFLSLILRAIRANSGVIQVAGRDLTTLMNWRVPEYRQQLGVVFQNFRLLQNKTVYQNVAFALQVIGKPKHAIAQLVPEALRVVGLEDKMDRMPWELSGGEQQRVAIARAFVNRPLLILADEPTGNLDPTVSAQIMQVFEMINQMGTTIIMATHSEEIVNSSHKRVIELRGGKLVRDEKDALYSGAPNVDFKENVAPSAPTAPIPTPEFIPNDVSQSAPPVQNVAPEQLAPIENATIKVPKFARPVASNVAYQDGGAPVGESNTTVRIPKFPRTNDFALDEYTDYVSGNDAFDNFFEPQDQLFPTGSVDLTDLRNDLGYGKRKEK